MAKDPLAISSVPLNPEGMNDNVPLNSNPTWYQTDGCHSLHELCIQRTLGKHLLQKFESAILQIHAKLKGAIWVETVDTLYLFTEGDEIPPEVGEVTFVDTPSVHWSI